MDEADVLTEQQAREWCAASIDFVRQRALAAAFIGHMKKSVPVFLDALAAAKARIEELESEIRLR